MVEEKKDDKVEKMLSGMSSPVDDDKIAKILGKSSEKKEGGSKIDQILGKGSEKKEEGEDKVSKILGGKSNLVGDDMINKMLGKEPKEKGSEDKKEDFEDKIKDLLS